MNSKKIKDQSAKVLANVSMKVAAGLPGCCYIFHQPKMPEALKQIKKH